MDGGLESQGSRRVLLSSKYGWVVWPKCLPRPHAEEHRSATRAQVLPTAVARCDASRSMRARAVAVLILRDACTHVRVCGTTSARTLLRMRTSIAYCRTHHVKQPISFPRPHCSQPGLSAWRAGSLPPEAAVASRRRRTPHLAPPSGCLRTTPSMSEDANLVAR